MPDRRGGIPVERPSVIMERDEPSRPPEGSTLARDRTRTKPRRPPKVTRETLAPGACLCDHCVGKCCRYFSLPIETPTTWDDFDAVRWYLAHGRTLVYVEEGTW